MSKEIGAQREFRRLKNKTLTEAVRGGLSEPRTDKVMLNKNVLSEIAFRSDADSDGNRCDARSFRPLSLPQQNDRYLVVSRWSESFCCDHSLIAPIACFRSSLLSHNSQTTRHTTSHTCNYIGAQPLGQHRHRRGRLPSGPTYAAAA